ncbi:MAG: nucleoside diphosphate kinase regulator [Hyphomicrobiales bacterium]
MTRQANPAPPALPPLVLSKEDYHRLSSLATAAQRHLPDAAARLSDEIERAELRASVPSDVVTMNALVRFRDETTGIEREIRLVYPPDADIASGRVSILTPIGTALIGLAEGGSIDWTTPERGTRRFTVLAVTRKRLDAS